MKNIIMLNDLDAQSREHIEWMDEHLQELKAAALKLLRLFGAGALMVTEDKQSGGYYPLSEIFDDDIRKLVLEYDPKCECVVVFPMQKGVYYYTVGESVVNMGTVQ